MASKIPTWLINVAKPRSSQDPGCASFVGGLPRLPAESKSPVCKNCGAIQTFFWQVAFPEGHLWAGLTLAVFACTACQDKDQPVPAVDRTLCPTLKRMDLATGEDVPDGALDLYQKVCRFLVFPTAGAVLRPDHPERVRYRPIVLEPGTDAKPTLKSKVGGRPGWVYDDLSPGNYQGEPLRFLMQWRHGFEFDRLPKSPPPYNAFADMEPGLTGGVMSYRLFLGGTQLYFFGNQAGGRPHVLMKAIRA